VAGAVATALLALGCVAGFTLAVRGRRGRWARTLVVTVPFGLAVALGPILLREALARLTPAAAHDGLVALGQAVLGAFLFGAFLAVLVLTGLEPEEGFAALGHPGFRHFVRIRVHPDGGLDAWVIGKDDPLGPGPPVLVDRFAWRRPP
jgi:hypothetical protein